jgi:threonine/homoserine/homoserine lactone efflux protein
MFAMLAVHDLPMFVLAGLLLAMSPGPDTAYILRRSGRQGWRGGSAAALGIALGIWVHILAAAAGFSALILASASAFTAAKLVGAGYLFYLGIAAILRSAKGSSRYRFIENSMADASSRAIFWQGFLTNVLNPKVALFFLAFLPQFINAGPGSKAVSFLFLGVVFDVVGTSWNLFIARAAVQVASWAKGSTAMFDWIDRSVGGIFIYLGLRLAIADRH